MGPFLLTLFAFAFFSAGISPAAAQTWPERPVTMVVPFAAGGGTDLLGRIVAKRLDRGARPADRRRECRRRRRHDRLGARGQIARPTATPWSSAPPPTPSTSRSTRPRSTISPTDLVPAGLMGNQPTVLLARKDFPANTLQEFAAYVKANPASVQFGSAGAGSTGHLFCELLNAALGIGSVTHVPYRGGGPAMQDLIAGRYDYICTLEPDRQAVDRGQYGQGHRHPAAETLARAFRACRARPSRACPISTSAPGLACSSRRARRSRSSESSTPRWRQLSTHPGCTSASRKSSRTWRRVTSARPNI